MGSAASGLEPTAREGGPTLDQLSLVLCTRDRPELLSSALVAIEQVVPPEVERIVVDSGSTTDETARVATAAGVHYIRSDIPGLSIARNAGLAATARDFALFTDDDCELQAGCAEKLLTAFASPTVGAVTGTLRDSADVRPTRVEAPLRVITSTLDGLDAGHGALMAFRVKSLRRVGGFDPVLGAGRTFGGAEDLDAFCRILYAGDEVVHVPSAVVHHVFTRSDDDFEALNRAYGLGIGAMSRKWVRGAGGTGGALAAKAARRAATRLGRGISQRRARRGHIAYLTGLATGYRRAGRIPMSGLVFVDEPPPAPVALLPGQSRGRTAI